MIYFSHFNFMMLVFSESGLPVKLSQPRCHSRAPWEVPRSHTHRCAPEGRPSFSESCREVVQRKQERSLTIGRAGCFWGFRSVVVCAPSMFCRKEGVLWSVAGNPVREAVSVLVRVARGGGPPSQRACAVRGGGRSVHETQPHAAGPAVLVALATRTYTSPPS